LGIKEHLRSSSRGSSARLFPTPAMVEVDLRSSSGEALKQLGYAFEDAAEVRSFTANRRAQVRGPAGPCPPRHTPVRASVVQRHQPDVCFGCEKREIDQPIIARKRNTQAKIMLGTSGEHTKSTRAPHEASHFVLIDAYPSFSYSRLASCCIGMFESAFFQSSKKWSYASRLFALSPISAAARAIPR